MPVASGSARMEPSPLPLSPGLAYRLRNVPRSYLVGAMMPYNTRKTGSTSSDRDKYYGTKRIDRRSVEQCLYYCRYELGDRLPCEVGRGRPEEVLQGGLDCHYSVFFALQRSCRQLVCPP